MAQYINAQKINFSKAEESRFRKLFNQWAASIEGYESKNLGDVLKIIEVYDSPIYRGLIRSQYDNRELENTYKRANKECPPRTITSESQINRWKLLSYPTEFTVLKKSYYVPGTEYITNCPECAGSGSVRCNRCGGNGRTSRKIVKTVPCKDCGGRGYNEKIVTKRETEYYYDYVRKIRTSREVEKPYTERDYCVYCHGSGQREDISYKEESCSDCNAKGYVTCGKCNGEKKMINYWRITHNQYVKRHTDYVFPSMIAQEDALKMRELLNGTITWQVVENIRINNEDFNHAELSSRPIVGSMLAKLPNTVEHTRHTAICFHNIEVSECEAKTVIYQVDKSQFVCMLIGSEWRLFTVDSPISQRVNDLKEQVNDLCKRHKYGKAWELLQKVNKYPQAGSAEAEMMEQLEERMAMATRFGVNLAMMICATLVAPFIYTLFTQLDAFAPWSHFLMDKLDITPGAMTLFSFVIIALVAMKYKKVELNESSYKIVSPLKRVFKGFVIGIKESLFYLTVVIAAAIVGVLPIVCLVIKWALTIVFMIVAIVSMLFKGIFG